MTTDTSEKGLESLIVRHMAGTDGLAVPPNQVAEPSPPYGGTGYTAGSAQDYDRAHALDVPQLFTFLRATQPEAFKKLAMVGAHDAKDINRLKFLARLSSEVGKRGVIDVLRKGVAHGPVHLDLFYGTPSPGNAKAAALHALNRFSVTRQLAYSMDETRRALDLSLFINGLPIATFELKNSLTKQTVEDAVEQYRRDRDPRERLFEFGRCAVHFAVDDSEVRMCTELRGKGSWFLPFDKGFNDGAGNPPNPHGLKTDYLWKEVLTPAGLTNILENYAQIVEEKDPRTGKKKRRQVWPRYHQLGVVRQALAHVREHGAGRRYLVQHSAGTSTRRAAASRTPSPGCRTSSSA
jgi:type I restriction enzyme, R subunit